MKPRLNLGCGSDKWGDVRLDIRETGATNFVFDFDSLPLPFEDKHFSECRLWHVLEHSKNPQRLLSEAIRVSDMVHAKFPYKYDRVPFVLSMISSLNVKFWYYAFRDCFWHIMTQAGLTESPWAHRWMVKPFGKSVLNRIGLLTMFESGRKAKYLRRFSKILSMDAEWECCYPS